MTFTEAVLLAILCIASVLMAYGVFLINTPCGYIVSGVLLATIAILFLIEVGD